MLPPAPDAAAAAADTSWEPPLAAAVAVLPPLDDALRAPEEELFASEDVPRGSAAGALRADVGFTGWLATT